MRGKHNIILLGLLIALSGCATTNQTSQVLNNATEIVSHGTRITLPNIETGKRPEWLVRDSQAYPHQDYYSVTRQANSAEAAAKKAYDSAYKLLRPEQSFSSAEQPQIRLATLWHNQGQNLFHALAVIPRHQAEAYLRQQLDKLDTATQANVVALNITEDPLAKIGLLQTVIERQQLRAAIQKSLKKVDPAKEGRESPWNTRSWSLQMAALLKELRIIPIMDISLSNTTALTPMLKQGLENAGLRPARSFEADYILSGKLDIYEKELNNGYIQANGLLQLTLRHKENQTRYGTQNWALEVTAISAEGAKERLLHKARRLLTTDKRETIIGIAAQSDKQP